MRSLKQYSCLGLALTLLICVGGSTSAQSKKQKPKKQPQVEVPTAWTTAPADGVSTDEAQLKEWWRNFHNPQLDKFVAQALSANADLKIATARVIEVRALRGVANSARFPPSNKPT